MKKNTLFGIGLTTGAIALAAALVTVQAAGSEGRRAWLDQQASQQAGQQGRGGRGGRIGPDGPGGRFGGALAGLSLSEEQRTKVAEIQRASRDQAAPVEQELRALEKELHRELFADARDAGKVGDLSAKVGALRQQLAALNIQTSGSLADVLTAEQRATVREREGRAGPGRGGPGRGGPNRGFGRLR